MDGQIPKWEEFENLVSKILATQGFKIHRNQARGDKGFDLIGETIHINWAIEVKYYRTSRVQPSLIEAAVARVVKNGTAQGLASMLVVSSVIPTPLRESLRELYQVIIIDRGGLRYLALEKAPALAEELDALLEIDSEAKGESPKKPIITPPPSPASSDTITSPLIDTRGSDLIAQLRALTAGRDSWSEYESLCMNILKYLLPNDLEGWHKQFKTDDELNRYDFVCRIRSSKEFWRFLVENLNSRYVIFEFKNYSEKIKQGQVLTTEKYLLDRALRKVAIVLTRKGPDSNAIKMVQGAMREHGKLIVVLNDDEICKMLKIREEGEDPSDYLFEKTDSFLLSLPR